MNYLVFDIETANQFSDVASNNPADLDISVVGVYDAANDAYRAYLVDELPELWPVVERSDMLIGYNSDHFDVPLLNKYYSGDLRQIKSLDLMREVKNVIGRRIKLDTIAEATLDTKKSGHGLDAIVWWRNGDVEKVKKYCLDDVRITKELYDYAVANGTLKYTDYGETKDITLDTSGWRANAGDSASMTHTLPF